MLLIVSLARLAAGHALVQRPTTRAKHRPSVYGRCPAGDADNPRPAFFRLPDSPDNMKHEIASSARLGSRGDARGDPR
jgi:hypothetical protein